MKGNGFVLTFIEVTSNTAAPYWCSVIRALKNKTEKSAITFGCKYAGAKCGQVGLKNIKF